jgi:hypothetical protein
MTLVILRVLDAVLGLRVSEEEEKIGLDLSQHGERAHGERVYALEGLSVLKVAELTTPQRAGATRNGKGPGPSRAGGRPGIETTRRTER